MPLPAAQGLIFSNPVSVDLQNCFWQVISPLNMNLVEGLVKYGEPLRTLWILCRVRFIGWCRVRPWCRIDETTLNAALPEPQTGEETGACRVSLTTWVCLKIGRPSQAKTSWKKEDRPKPPA